MHKGTAAAFGAAAVGVIGVIIAIVADPADRWRLIGNAGLATAAVGIGIGVMVRVMTGIYAAGVREGIRLEDHRTHLRLVGGRSG